MTKKKPKKRLTRAQKARLARRRKRIRRVIGGIIAAVLVLAISALGLYLLFSHEPEPMVTTIITEYQDIIRKNAEEQGLDPAYVASVIMAESSYRPEVVSSVGAQGLMQIMPDTGEWLAGKFDEDYLEGSLFQPEVNIRYGCWYLGFLMRRYDGNMRCASAAFHSGQGTVDKWLDDPMYSSDGKTLDNIPSDVAGTYVERILRYYEEYKKVYG